MALTLLFPATHALRNHVILITITLILLGLGYYLSVIHFLDKEWLSRSGSLIVVLGIISGFSGIIEERLFLSRLEIRKRIELLQKKRKLRLLKVAPKFVDEELQDIEEKFEALADESMSSIKFNAGLIEGILLIFGTTVWGFGDILLAFI
ncbi:hypothetical protein [Psychromonas algicola]|uniref:hypothetical protein n=1 Tax=Psychromonas algicola TaxID=2555642 RepID=UPI0010685016|nr:hypothetical protein [Psychromonas sp. RZ5]TEW44086.1 hypothetical protein E2R67_15290 [Psychromonas sp. RZ5]